MRYLAKFDQAGNRLSSIAEGIHFVTAEQEAAYLAEGYQEITESEQALYQTNEYIRGENGQPQPKPAYVPTLAERKAKLITAAQAAFAAKRDAIRWVEVTAGVTYGFDSASEDITNFMAAYTPLLVSGEGTVQYKVWTSESTKGIVTLTTPQMTSVYQTVRASQFAAYAWYEQTKAQIEAADEAALAQLEASL